MYNDFRLNILCELTKLDLGDDIIRQVIGIVDMLGGEYEVSKKCTSLVTVESTSQRILMEYIACKSLEGFSKQTLSNYYTTLNKFILAVRKPLDEIRTNDIRAYLYQYQNIRKISNRTLDKMRITLHGFFKWALAEEKIECDPTAAVGPIKFVIEQKPSLSQIELEQIRKKLGNARERAIVEMFYSTGCRVSELCGMKKSDIDWDNGTVLIFGKGSKFRTGFLNAKAIVALKDYLDSRNDNSEYLFVTERKPYRKLTRAAVEKIIRIISKRSFYLTGKNVTPHIFRHTTITTALHNGMSLQNVSKMAGHSQVKTTMDYASIDNSDVQYDHSKYVI